MLRQAITQLVVGFVVVGTVFMVALIVQHERQAKHRRQRERS